VVHDRALIGSGSIVLHEAVIHSGATVAAGAVVRNLVEVPANAAAMGVPATIRLDFSSPEEVALLAALYVANAHRYREELRAL
jgi:carbonic anhydrase/acetyltransferase-like protein (isoleucine patch superfamily)